MAVRGSRRSGHTAAKDSQGVSAPEVGTKGNDKSDGQKVQTWRAFSENPDKAWAEKWFLAYSPVWPILFFLWTNSGFHLHVGDVGNMAVTLLIALPNIAVPMLFNPRFGLQWYEQYWFKFSVWIWVFGFVASYFFTEYFFDVLGMKYHFPHLSWNLDSELVGTGAQVVPLMMYFHAWYFFVTYHTCSVIFIRIIRTAPGFRAFPLLSNIFSVVFAAWLFSWGEIYGTTMDAIKDQFTYNDVDWALKWGALCYSCYFIASFPMVFNLDEKPSTRWTMQKTLENSFAASMIAFLLLDVVTQYVITDWKER